MNSIHLHRTFRMFGWALDIFTSSTNHMGLGTCGVHRHLLGFQSFTAAVQWHPKSSIHTNAFSLKPLFKVFIEVPL